VNKSEAARPMPLPAPVMMTDLPSRRPMSFSLLNFYPRRCSSKREESASRTDWLAAFQNFKQDFKRGKVA
jgi:hypothetical protein